MEKQIKIYILIALLILLLTGLSYFYIRPKEINSDYYNINATETDKTEEAAENRMIEEELIEEEIREEEVIENKIIEEENREQPLEEIIEPVENRIEIQNFKSDKDTYGSREKIQFSLLLLSNNDIKEAEIKINGIQPYQYAYINKSKMISLNQGENTIIIEAEAPTCTSGCGGVRPGPYDIVADILINNEIIESEIIIINLTENN